MTSALRACALPLAALLLASAAPRASAYLVWNGKSASMLDETLWLDETCVDGKGCVSVNPTMEAPAIKTTSVVGGVTGVVPKGGTLMVGNTLRFTLGSQLIIKAPGAGDKATSILLTKHTEGGAEVVFVPGSQKGDDKAGGPFDMKCHTNWLKSKTEEEDSELEMVGMDDDGVFNGPCKEDDLVFDATKRFAIPSLTEQSRAVEQLYMSSYGADVVSKEQRLRTSAGLGEPSNVWTDAGEGKASETTRAACATTCRPEIVLEFDDGRAIILVNDRFFELLDDGSVSANAVRTTSTAGVDTVTGVDLDFDATLFSIAGQGTFKKDGNGKAVQTGDAPPAGGQASEGGEGGEGAMSAAELKHLLAELEAAHAAATKAWEGRGCHEPAVVAALTKAGLGGECDKLKDAMDAAMAALIVQQALAGVAPASNTTGTKDTEDGSGGSGDRAEEDATEGAATGGGGGGGDSGGGMGPIIGGVVGGLVVLAIIAFVVYRKKQSSGSHDMVANAISFANPFYERNNNDDGDGDLYDTQAAVGGFDPNKKRDVGAVGNATYAATPGQADQVPEGLYADTDVDNTEDKGCLAVQSTLGVAANETYADVDTAGTTPKPTAGPGAYDLGHSGTTDAGAAYDLGHSGTTDAGAAYDLGHTSTDAGAVYDLGHTSTDAGAAYDLGHTSTDAGAAYDLGHPDAGAGANDDVGKTSYDHGSSSEEDI